MIAINFFVVATNSLKKTTTKKFITFECDLVESLLQQFQFKSSNKLLTTNSFLFRDLLKFRKPQENTVIQFTSSEKSTQRMKEKSTTNHTAQSNNSKYNCKASQLNV